MKDPSSTENRRKVGEEGKAKYFSCKEGTAHIPAESEVVTYDCKKDIRREPFDERTVAV
jgi:hypothetical protein